MTSSSRRVLQHVAFWVAIVALPLVMLTLGRAGVDGSAILRVGAVLFFGAAAGMLPWTIVLYRREQNSVVGVLTCATLLLTTAVAMPRGLLALIGNVWPAIPLIGAATFATFYFLTHRIEQRDRLERAKRDGLSSGDDPPHLSGD